MADHYVCVCMLTRTANDSQTFIGHGEAINDISVHYKRPHLPITASRVWMGLGGPITAVGLWVRVYYLVLRGLATFHGV